MYRECGGTADKVGPLCYLLFVLETTLGLILYDDLQLVVLVGGILANDWPFDEVKQSPKPISNRHPHQQSRLGRSRSISTTLSAQVHTWIVWHRVCLGSSHQRMRRWAKRVQGRQGKHTAKHLPIPERNWVFTTQRQGGDLKRRGQQIQLEKVSTNQALFNAGWIGHEAIFSLLVFWPPILDRTRYESINHMVNWIVAITDT